MNEFLPNVVSLANYKERYQESKFRKNYDNYLKLLKNEELEHEVNFLLDEFSHDNYGNEFFLKGEMILGEIAIRVEQPLASSIQNMAKILTQEKSKSTLDS